MLFGQDRAGIELKENTIMATRKKTGIQAGEVFDLKKLVDYGEDSVVSRILIKDKAGSVTLFAFDTDQELSEHTSPYNAFIQVIDGVGEFIIDGKSSQVTEGQVILLPANIPHAVNAASPFKMMLVMIRK